MLDFIGSNMRPLSSVLLIVGYYATLVPDKWRPSCLRGSSACDLHDLQLFCAVQAVFVNYRLLWTPEPLSAAAPPHLFSEQRALKHVQQLSISGRLVSHPDIEKAVQYILHSSNLLVADAAHRNDVTVEVGLRFLFCCVLARPVVQAKSRKHTKQNIGGQAVWSVQTWSADDAYPSSCCSGGKAASERGNQHALP